VTAPETAAQSPLELEREIARRRTFAIISHPDAGKTTLTEKFLLYSGAVEEAGSVRARKNARHATSDWMSMEQKRGISITSTALQFDYEGIRYNLVDTPGHQDFSEDTYRVLVAVDSAVMVLDAARGIEPQTLKLFHVCRMRGIPLVTFVNKMDQNAKDPLELLDELERVLGIRAVPFTWPIGDGPFFQGVYDLRRRRVMRFERSEGNRTRAPMVDVELESPELDTLLGAEAAATLRSQVELVEMAIEPYTEEDFLAGLVTPVFFGSALNNFGVEPFLRDFAELAPPPPPRESSKGEVDPADEEFSGFVFKIQANMDPQHRDRMAFLRVCSGVFERDMAVNHPRLGKKIRMSRPHRLFASQRETVDTAYPGDVVGLVNPGVFRIGDTVTSGKGFEYEAMPKFSPERFAVLENRDISKGKQFQRGLAQLEEEGAIQVLYPEVGTRSEPILAAVGELQFDVVMSRLNDEYNVPTHIRHMEHTTARWVADEAAIGAGRLPQNTIRTRDTSDRLVLVFPSDWALSYFERENQDVQLSDVH
jgi:peptide chain release factor 3